jgi:CRP-like cAMP-binding protein
MQMQPSLDTRTGNRLLDALTPKSRGRLQPHLEPVTLKRKMRLEELDHVHFPLAGLISVVATMEGGDSIEVGMVGREGMYGIAAILTDDTPTELGVVQLPGRSLRMRTRLLRQEMQADGALQTLLLRYAEATMSAIAQSAACNRLHLLEQRCARWLLACHDRAEADTFPMTHEFLALMLGVRRPGVSVAAHALQESGVITYNHGTLTVEDRQGLEATACECYRVVQNKFDRVFAVTRGASAAAN